MKGIIVILFMLYLTGCAHTRKQTKNEVTKDLQERHIECIQRLMESNMTSEQARLSCEQIFKSRS